MEPRLWIKPAKNKVCLHKNLLTFTQSDEMFVHLRDTRRLTSVQRAALISDLHHSLIQIFIVFISEEVKEWRVREAQNLPEHLDLKDVLFLYSQRRCSPGGTRLEEDGPGPAELHVSFMESQHHLLVSENGPPPSTHETTRSIIQLSQRRSSDQQEDWDSRTRKMVPDPDSRSYLGSSLRPEAELPHIKLWDKYLTALNWNISLWSFLSVMLQQTCCTYIYIYLQLIQ